MPKSYIGEVSCNNCNIKFKKRILPDTKRHYCSTACKRADKKSYISEWTEERRNDQSNRNKGSNNPNYGNTWTALQRENFSKYKKKQYKENPNLAYECGKSNRGVKFSEERVKAMHQHRDRESYIRSHSVETRSKISKKSKEKWTEEYLKNHRQTMEELGYWVPLSEKDPYSIYYKEANWIENMIDYFNDEERSKLKEHGIFSKNNPKGWVRDHIVSRKLGYEKNLPPEILRHPANLQFISHSENIAKGFNDRLLTDSEKNLTIKKLFERIKNYPKEWKETKKCLTYLTGAKGFKGGMSDE